MPSVDPNIVVHSLNIRPYVKPIKQKRMRMNEEKTKTSNEEVEKLLKARFIREVKYLELVSNDVMAMKKNGTW